MKIAERIKEKKFAFGYTKKKKKEKKKRKDQRAVQQSTDC